MRLEVRSHGLTFDTEGRELFGSFGGHRQRLGGFPEPITDLWHGSCNGRGVCALMVDAGRTYRYDLANGGCQPTD